VIRTEEFGNINGVPLEVLIEKHRGRLLFLDYRDVTNIPGKCATCLNNENCFGCRSNAYYYSGDVCAADPMCQSCVTATLPVGDENP